MAGSYIMNVRFEYLQMLLLIMFSLFFLFFVFFSFFCIFAIQIFKMAPTNSERLKV